MNYSSYRSFPSCWMLNVQASISILCVHSFFASICLMKNLNSESFSHDWTCFCLFANGEKKSEKAFRYSSFDLALSDEDCKISYLPARVSSWVGGNLKLNWQLFLCTKQHVFHEYSLWIQEASAIVISFTESHFFNLISREYLKCFSRILFLNVVYRMRIIPCYSSIEKREKHFFFVTSKQPELILSIKHLRQHKKKSCINLRVIPFSRP